MSYLPILSLLVVPVGALAIGAWALWLTKADAPTRP